MSEDFSPAERAYFESAGKDTSALDAEIASGGSQTAESPTHSAPTGQSARTVSRAGRMAGSCRIRPCMPNVSAGSW
jgi:hypothetical protein